MHSREVYVKLLAEMQDRDPDPDYVSFSAIGRSILAEEEYARKQAARMEASRAGGRLVRDGWTPEAGRRGREAARKSKKEAQGA